MPRRARRGLSRRSFAVLAPTAATAGTAAMLARPAIAQAYPSRPIQVVLGFTAGGPTDVSTRTIAPFIEKHLGGGASLTVVNRAGAGGEIAWTEVANARPDGYTVAVLSTPAFVSFPVERRTRYDVNSFAYAGTVVEEVGAMIVRPDSPWRSVQDLIAAAKADPGGIPYASAGVGGGMHLATLQLEKAAGIKLRLVPTRGANDAKLAVMGNHVPLAAVSGSGAVEGHRQNEVRVLGLMSENRLSFAPDLPTFREQGLDVVVPITRGFGFPKATPPEIVARWTEALRKVAQDPEYRAVAERESLLVNFRDPAAYRAYVEREDRILREIWRESPWRTVQQR